jgi:UDP-N-acetylglucosamine--dolichyl-phosphate N-acetylglucosaminephosphotransferase
LTYLYPLVVVPIAIVGASNGFNMVAGYNGLEAGMGAIILFVMGFVAWYNGVGWVAVIALCMVFSLIAFLIFNKYPARIFPGDTLTYTVGALIACLAIVGNMEKLAIVMFLPYIFTLPLKLRGLMQKQSYGRLLSDGSLALPYSKFYGIEHVVLCVWKKFFGVVYEEDVVSVFYYIELFLGLFVLLVML